MDNRVVMAKSYIKMRDFEEAVSICESIYTSICRNTIWTSSLGPYLVECLKIIYEIEVTSLDYNLRCQLYYIFEMLHFSYQLQKPTRESFFMDKLKTKVEELGGMKNFFHDVAERVLTQKTIFSVENVVNTTYEQFLKKYSSQEVSKVLEASKLVYMCLGADFLIYTLKPVVFPYPEHVF